MSLIFYSEEENNIKEESINNYKDLFLNYENEKPTLSEALTQMFISSGAEPNQSNDLVNDILLKCKSTIDNNLDKITKEYPNFSKEDAEIICSYTCESKENKYSPYKLINRNLISENRKNGINNISKYLFILLRSLRKLKRFYLNEENKYLYRCIPNKVNISEDPFNKKNIPFKVGNIKTFWGFTSTSENIKMTYNFLKEEEKIKSGTIFILEGDIWGYNITLFNYYGEEEILLEPERKYKVVNVLPPVNELIYVNCKILTTPLVLDNNNNTIEENNINKNNYNNIDNDNDDQLKELNIKKCICNIEQEIKINNEYKYISGLGFICNIPNKNMKAFITYNHIIDFEFLKNEQKLIYYNYKKEKKEINLKLNRYRYTNEEIDITIIEIIEEDKIIKYIEIDDCINSRDYNNNNILYYKLNEIKNIEYIERNISKKNEEYIIENIDREGIVILKQNLKIIGIINNKKYIHMNKIINKINYIKGIIEIKKQDIGKKIQILNNKNYYDTNTRNKEIEEKIKIIINGEIKSNILKYEFEKEGEYKIYYISEELNNMAYMFSRCSGLKKINLTSFKTDKVINMSYMFNRCSRLKEINLSSFKTDNVTNMSGMFCGCSRLKEINLSSFKTDNVTNMSGMFCGCSRLKEINLLSFKTDNVTNMYRMFSGCSGLKDINLTSFKTDKVTNMSDMFYDVKSCNLKCEDEKILNLFKTETQCFIF